MLEKDVVAEENVPFAAVDEDASFHAKFSDLA